MYIISSPWRRSFIICIRTGELVLTDTTANVFEITGTSAITKIEWDSSVIAAPAGTEIFMTFINDADEVSEVVVNGQLFLSGNFVSATTARKTCLARYHYFNKH